MRNIIGYTMVMWLFFCGLAVTAPVFAEGVGPQFCGPNNSGVSTAIGCIPATSAGFTSKLFSLSLGTAGGIAFLLIVIGGLQIQTSTGNPDRMNQGREIIEGAIIGLLLIILSVFILRVVGMDILGIPGFRP
jgi:hypothetical protein